MSDPSFNANAGAPAGAPGAPVGQTGNGDALDKGLQSLADKSGYGNKVSHSNIEKASDGLRGMFKKITGKDAPIKDQDYK